jgi:hypothetical protein
MIAKAMTAKVENPAHEAIEFFIETKYQRLARRSGGIPRDQAIKNAEKHIAEAKPKFRNWLDEEIAELAKSLPADGNAAHDLRWMKDADKHCQFLADVGATLDFAMVSFIANNMCLIFDAVRNGAPYRHDIVTCYLDALRLASRDEHRNLRPQDVPELSAGLRRVLESGGPRAIA